MFASLASRTLTVDGHRSAALRRSEDVAGAAAIARDVAVQAGASPEEADQVQRAAYALADNALQHAGGGTLTARAAFATCVVTVTDTGGGDVTTLRLLAADARPGVSPTGVRLVRALMHGLSFEARPAGGISARAWKLCGGRG